MSDTPATTDEFGPALAAMQAMNPDSLLHRMQIEILEGTPDRVVGRMPVAGNTQPYQLLAGGASIAFAETLASTAATLYAGPDQIAVGVEVSASHHRSARADLVRGVAKAVHLGGSLASYDVGVFDRRDRKLCSCRVTCMIRPRP